MIVKRLAFALCGLMFAAPAYAAHWNVDYAKSALGFSVVWDKEPFSGAFQSWKADIDFDPADLAHARADVSIDPGSEKSDEPDFDDGLKGALGFQVKDFATARFTAAHFTHKSGDAYVGRRHADDPGRCAAHHPALHAFDQRRFRPYGRQGRDFAYRFRRGQRDMGKAPAGGA